MDSALSNYILFWICIVGLCLGSFYNVVILRSLSGESMILPPSKCPKCGNKLKPWHNIPVLSYIFLKGKCAFCGERISIQYPLIELTTMLLFAASFLKFGLSLKMLFAMILSSCLLIMTMTDLKEKLVDCNIAIGLAIAGLAYNHSLDSLLGLLAGVVVLEIIARSGYLFTKERAMGEADTYVAGALGACFGLSGLGFVLLYALLASMLFTVPVFLYNQYKNGHIAVCILSVLFAVSVLVFKFGWENYITLAFLGLSGIALAMMILRGLKKEPSPIYLPFVPAFALGALYFLFF